MHKLLFILFFIPINCVHIDVFISRLHFLFSSSSSLLPFLSQSPFCPFLSFLSQSLHLLYFCTFFISSSIRRSRHLPGTLEIGPELLLTPHWKPSLIRCSARE